VCVRERERERERERGGEKEREGEGEREEGGGGGGGRLVCGHVPQLHLGRVQPDSEGVPAAPGERCDDVVRVLRFQQLMDLMRARI